MAYVALADIKGRIPEAFLTQALDDDGDGVIDAWDLVAADADSAVNALLSVRYETPLTAPVPAVATEGARVAACYLCYQRRGTPDETNPWAGRYELYFGKDGLLTKIALGKAALSPEVKGAKPAAVLIKETSATFDTAGRRLS